MNKIWQGSAPSNIAIVKYMGKTLSGKNEATNPSVSMTLEDFRTSIEITLDPKLSADQWKPMNGLSLSEKGQDRFLSFFKNLKDKEGIRENFLIRSGNNFPADAGLASSASSFAALTLTAYTAFSDLKSKPLPTPDYLANISRTGSGSSCRSFFSPWCSWNGQEIRKVASRMPKLIDFVAILNKSTKSVSSSEAHKRVQTSPLFERRSERALDRWNKSLTAIESGDIANLAKIAWDDMWDMHSLFHTSDPSFSYLEPDTIAVLKFIEDHRSDFKNHPIVTIDAGPNVHMLVSDAEGDQFKAIFQQRFPKITLMESR